jgi:hypothetical protein
VVGDDPWQVLEERVGGVVQSTYAWSPLYGDAVIVRDRDADGNGSLDERLYAVQDANFNKTAVLDTSGSVVERYAYDPFGGFNALDGSWGARGSSNYACKYLFQGGGGTPKGACTASATESTDRRWGGGSRWIR